MTDPQKCERCHKLYLPYLGEIVDDLGNKIVIVVHQKNGTIRQADFCRDCMQDFVHFCRGGLPPPCFEPRRN